MLYEQYHPQDPLAPSTIEDGAHKLDSTLTALDFYLLDDIDVYLNSIQPTKAVNIDLINDSENDNSQHHDELFSDFDFDNLTPFDEQSGKNK